MILIKMSNFSFHLDVTIVANHNYNVVDLRALVNPFVLFYQFFPFYIGNFFPFMIPVSCIPQISLI